MTKSGLVTIIGAPNAGKSTLINFLIGSKVAITSPKVQTTRAGVKGILTEDGVQIVFTDTPGIFRPKRRLEKALVKNAWANMADADEVVVVVDASRKNDNDTADIIEALKHKHIKAFLLLNKTDIVKKSDLLALADKYFATGVFKEVFMISAVTGDGIDVFKQRIRDVIPEGPFYYDEDQITDMPLRMFVSEIVREKLFLNLRQELPYALTVETDVFKEDEKGNISVEQTIYVEKESQRKIILGRRGSMIKSIGQAARKELAEILGVKVSLFLYVKVKENWQEDKARYLIQGLPFD